MEKWKGGVVIMADDPYSWVSDAIKNQSSLFTSDEAMEMLSEGSWEFPFYVDEYLCPKFPLYWPCEPIQILDVEKRIEFEELVLEFLTSTEVMEEVLSCAELIKWEEDSQSVRGYFGEKVPGLNSTSMKAFLRQRASRKEVSVSEVCKGIGEEGGYTSSRVRHGSDDLSSLWDEDYPFTALAEDYGQSPTDVKLVTEAGALAVSRFMQVMGPRMISMGRTQEKMLLKMFEKKTDVSKMESLLKEKENIVSSLTATIETKEYEGNVLKNCMESLEKQLNEQRGLFESKVARLEVDLKEKIEQGYEMYVQGFERAVSQVRVIAPDVDVSKMDVTKVVVNGVMVDDDIIGQDEESVGESVGKV
ncbi:hypothetical protein PIB30_029985 [Stylosanthes scabra]|uniref:Uncharacterized protein n=1 Tax=Stylosanthes scabra TaxID=79078 RepID=A0ABU6ZA43_9FABA|nr:hypothetical protein [Stylosanthes scabra]